MAASDPAGVLQYDQREHTSYLQSTGASTMFSKVLSTLIMEKPADPITFMIETLKTMSPEDYMPPPDSDFGDEETFAYDDGADGGADPLMSNEDLQEMILEAFLAADADGNGYLDRKELSDVLNGFDIGLTSKQIKMVMAEIDENEDGVIEYREFMPVMVDLIHAFQAKREAEDQQFLDEEEAEFEAEDYLLRGMTQEELEGLMTDIFKQFDSDGNGVLDRKEFKACLKSAKLGLTRKDINALLTEADENSDGGVSYEEFTPLCFRILLERFKQDFLASKALQSADNLELEIVSSLEEADKEGTGKLTRKAIRGVMEDLSYDVLGLTRVQLVSIMSMADADGEGLIDIIKFARAATGMVYSLMDRSQQKTRADAIEKFAQTEGAHLLHNLEPAELRGMMLEAFRAVDEDAVGALAPDQVYDVLQELGNGDMLKLSNEDVNSMLAAVDENDDGFVEYEELVDFIIDVLMHLDRDRYVAGISDTADTMM